MIVVMAWNIAPRATPERTTVLALKERILDKASRRATDPKEKIKAKAVTK
jgi:hypothetical protein